MITSSLLQNLPRLIHETERTDTFDSILPTEIGFKDHLKNLYHCMLYAVMYCDAIARDPEIPCALLLCGYLGAILNSISPTQSDDSHNPTVIAPLL